MSTNNPQSIATINPESAGCRVRAIYWDRDVDVYSVFDHEFKNIKSAASQSGLFLTFFGISFGAMLTLLIVLFTVQITNPWTFASFTVGFAVSVLTTALLALKARHEYKQTGSQFDYIETRSRGKKIIPPASD